MIVTVTTISSVEITKLNIEGIEGIKVKKRGERKKISVIQCIWYIIRYMNSINQTALIVIHSGSPVRDLVGPSP